jgi:hypothetical protein
MSAPFITEATVLLIRDYLQTNMPTALAAVDSARPDKFVGLESPQSYFVYERATGYKVPAIFVIAPEVDFKLGERAANFINASIKVNIGALLEDRNQEHLTYKAWRYQSALHQLLAQTEITNTGNTVTITITVDRATFSGLYTDSAKDKNLESVFRKEVMLECEVIHRENY